MSKHFDFTVQKRGAGRWRVLMSVDRAVQGKTHTGYFQTKGEARREAERAAEMFEQQGRDDIRDYRVTVTDLQPGVFA
jgi:hypothetical protein